MNKEKTKPCPHCGKKVKWENNPYRPFCSERCKLIDLGEWASEKYKIPGEKAGGGEFEKDNSNRNEDVLKK